MTPQGASPTGDDYIERLEGYFGRLVEKYLPGDRSDGLPDKVAFRMLMAVLTKGLTHKEATRGHCSEGALLFRHQEYVMSRVFAEFMLQYGDVHRHISNGLELPSYLFDDDSPFGKKAGR